MMNRRGWYGKGENESKEWGCWILNQTKRDHDNLKNQGENETKEVRKRKPFKGGTGD